MCASLTQELLIGRVFLAESCAQLDFSSRRIIFSNCVDVPLHDKLDRQSLFRAVNYVTVPPASEIALKIKCNQFYADQDVILTAVPGAQFHKFAIGNSICHVNKQGNTFCRLLNCSNRPLKLQPSETLGQIERIDKNDLCAPKIS